MAICKAIVEAHHGKISARNIVGDANVVKGAEFIFELPWTEPPLIEPDDSDVIELEK